MGDEQRMMMTNFWNLSFLVLGIALASSRVYAQTEASAPQKDSLLTTQEKKSPFEIAVIVNDEVITNYDIGQRLRFMIATTTMPRTQETMQKLFPRTVEMLIEEMLQRQEATRFNYRVEPAEITAAIATMEKEQGKPEGSFLKFLEANQIDKKTVEDQISTQIMWGKLLQQRIIPKLTVTPSDLARANQQVNNAEQKVEEVNISYLTLPMTMGRSEPETKELATIITQKLREGANFRVLGAQLAVKELTHLQPSWIPMRDLDPVLATKIAASKFPAVFGPVQTPTGYQILHVLGKRTSDYRVNVEVFFKEIIMTLAEHAQKSEVDALMLIAQDVRRNPGTCTNKDVATVNNIDDLQFKVNYVRTKLSDISPDMLSLVRPLRVGEVSEPFASPDGIRLLKLCEKTDLPSADVDEKKLTLKVKEQKFRQEAVKYIRTLRRDAFIDMRL
ncbi:MAG: hypothetical protein EAZ74_01290 [Alphaproteobacteria bacterium]|nr:MAG: hypothetical protein EAY76_05500 [Alphaproteobacteria bacterium]TAF15646.1 MAG: hypothetical protein EAZ74_01290 [Alphaproteobacteria bacterium]TAF41083.1 MAG: hypothetical protein EAZ66_01890 [Alphaproteobacteria bacterium]TAF76191.1 MAG: hypothetical protein EAZ52_04645 [Alphaproteobacteria bacterium]